MSDLRKVLKAWECCKNPFDRICEKCPFEKECCHDGIPDFVVAKAVDLLKEQDERYVNMVVSWLREMALNNYQDERPMTFVDAIENIRDRASCGLKQYFNDKLNEKQ